MFVLRSFGGLSLTGEFVPASAVQPRRLALLVLLARGRDGRVSRDKLLACLWPESASDSARHGLDALLLTILDRKHEAVVHARRAAELAPVSIQIQNTYGVMLFNVGALDSALHVYERIVTHEPDTAWVRQNPWVMSNFGMVAASAGKHVDAVRLIERAALAVPGHPRPLYKLAVAYLAVGDTRRAAVAFDRADPEHPDYIVYRAMLHALQGNLDAAFAWLDRVADWSPVTLLSIAGDPDLVPLRTDPRYLALRSRLALPQLR